MVNNLHYPHGVYLNHIQKTGFTEVSPIHEYRFKSVYKMIITKLAVYTVNISVLLVK